MAALPLRYPKSRFAPPPLADPAERERLTPAALRGFFNVMAKWGVRGRFWAGSPTAASTSRSANRRTGCWTPS
jgi:hypothetical protein